MKLIKTITTILAVSLTMLCWAAAAQAGWSSMTSGTDQNLRGVWGSSGAKVFAVGESATILQYDGSSWSTTGSGGMALNGVWGSSGSDVYAVGFQNATIRHYNGTTWSDIPSNPANFLAVWGSSATDIFAVGEAGTILHYNGTTWADMTDAGMPQTINGVWGSSGSDVYAVGFQNATIRHYNGSTWSTTLSGPENLYGVWGSSASDIFAVGDTGTILHYNGTSWSSMQSGGAGLKGVWGSSASDAFAVGENATILHYDGSSWSAMTSNTTAGLTGVWGSSCTDVFAVGSGGEILHYNGEGLTVAKTGTGSGAVASTTAGIDCGSVCTYPYCYGATVTLNATAADGSTFAGWSGGGCSGTGSCTVTMDNATTVTAEFTAAAPSCELQIIPKKIHKLLGLVAPIKGFVLIGDEATVFTRDDKPVWGTDAIRTLIKVQLGDRVIVALVLVNPFALTEGPADVTVGDCAGTIDVVKL